MNHKPGSTIPGNLPALSHPSQRGLPDLGGAAGVGAEGFAGVAAGLAGAGVGAGAGVAAGGGVTDDIGLGEGVLAGAAAGAGLGGTLTSMDL